LVVDKDSMDGQSKEDIIDDMKEPGGVIVLDMKKGAGQVPIEIKGSIGNLGIPEMIQMYMRTLQEVSGVHPAMQGQVAQSGTSGKLYQQQAQNSTLNSKDIMDSFASGQLRRDMKLLKTIQQYYDKPVMIAISGKSYSETAQLYDPEKLRAKLEEDFITSIPQGKVQTIDSSMLNYGLAVRKADKEDEEKAISIGSPTIVKEGVKDGVKLQTGELGFPLGNVIIKGVGGREEKATNVYVNRKTGKVLLRVENVGFETGSQKQTEPNEKGKAKLKQINPATKKNYTLNDLAYDEIKDVTTSNKAPQVQMLNFKNDPTGKIGRLAIKMNYSGAKEMYEDFINRAGGLEKSDAEQKPAKKTIKGF